MGQTTLMESQLESVIRRPAVVNQEPVIFGPQNRYRLLVSSSWQDGVYGHLRAHRHVQPLEPSAHFPAGFVHAVDGGLPRGFHQSVIAGSARLAIRASARYNPPRLTARPKP